MSRTVYWLKKTKRSRLCVLSFHTHNSQIPSILQTPLSSQMKISKSRGDSRIMCLTIINFT